MLAGKQLVFGQQRRRSDQHLAVIFDALHASGITCGTERAFITRDAHQLQDRTGGNLQRFSGSQYLSGLRWPKKLIKDLSPLREVHRLEGFFDSLTYLLKIKSHIRRHQPRAGRLVKVDRHHLAKSISQKNKPVIRISSCVRYS